MPDWYKREDEKRIHEELASQYKITLIQLYAIEFADDLFWCWLFDF
jgi:hypothetical protein